MKLIIQLCSSVCYFLPFIANKLWVLYNELNFSKAYVISQAFHHGILGSIVGH